MVSSDAAVQVSPDAFDFVVLRAVRRQKVKADTLPFRCLQADIHCLRRVNTVVVQNDMNCLCIGMLSQLPQHLDKQHRVLPVGLNPDEFTAADIERTGQITFLVFPRSRHLFLLSSVHPVQADFRIQMDVNFVFIERHLVPGQSLYQLANFP